MFGERTGVDEVGDIWDRFFKALPNISYIPQGRWIGVSYEGDAPRGYSSYFVGAEVRKGRENSLYAKWQMLVREYVVCGFVTSDISYVELWIPFKERKNEIIILEEKQMSIYEEGLKLIEEKFGNGKDNIISLATIAREAGANGGPRPVVRSVDAYYEDGVFYIMTNSKSNKMLQISQNSEVSVAGCLEMFTANGIGENLGWVLDPNNAEIRTKLRTSFANWYDMANNEKDENCCILAIRLTKGTLNVNHWEKLYHMDFINKTDMKHGGIL